MSDKIETMADWNARLAMCGCCSMPSAGAPAMECQSIGVSVNACGWSVDSTYFTKPLSCADSMRFSKSITSSDELNSTSIARKSNLPSLNDVYPTVIQTSSGSVIETITFRYAYATEPEGTKNRVCLMSVKYSGATTVANVNSYPDGYFDVEDGDDPIPYQTSATQQCTWGEDGAVTFQFSDTGANGYVATSSKENVLGCDRPWVRMTEWDSPVASGSISISTPADIENDEYGYSYESTGSTKYTFQTLSDLVREADLRMNDIGGWENAEGRSCSAWMLAFKHSCEDGEGAITSLAKSKTRYRWWVPSSWTGNYMKVTWDILTTPQKWTDWKTATAAYEAWKTAKAAWDKSTSPDKGASPTEPTKPGAKPPPPSLEKGKTVTWKGPGKGEQNNDSWIAGDWFNLDPPSEQGTRRIVNIRYESMPANPYGHKPEITGEGYDPANP